MNTISSRHCLLCKCEISECMGCVLSRDICAALDGLRPWNKIRELCWSCATKLEGVLLTLSDEALLELELTGRV